MFRKTNYASISRFANFPFFVPNQIQFERNLLLVTNAESYMIKTAISLKYFLKFDLLCFAHDLNRVAEKVRAEILREGTLINNAKKIILKKPLRVQIYRGYRWKNWGKI